MAQNLFEELQERKQQLVAMIAQATNYGWISAEQQKEMLTKLEQDRLTIGVIGQMKCGKSTFLNAFVFEEDVLPAATTPMTAALSVITYGPQKRVVAEFYTQDEWEEQKMQASRSLDEVQGNTLEESKVKAAKELVEKSSKLGSQLQRYLGKTQEDSFDQLIEYVGADGKYVSITKAVTIYYPKEYLKGVEIVDTPGFNDPIVSREERTKSFLKKADVVVMMLYAGRPFDATDRSILFQNVRQCGIGKVIIGINKYDIPYENGETEAEIKEYVKTEIKKACRACDDETLVEIMKEAEPIPLSAEMALLSELPMSQITSNEAYRFAWKRACDNFEISSQSQMREKSHLNDLTSAIKSLVENEKVKILFAKPTNAILAAGAQRKEHVDKELRECQSLIEGLNQPDDELEEREANINKADRRINRKLALLSDDLDDTFKVIIQKGELILEESVDDACSKMSKEVEAWKRFGNESKLDTKLQDIKKNLLNRTLKREITNIGEKVKSEIPNTIADFFDDVQDVLDRFMNDDFDTKDFIKNIKHKTGEIINREIISEDKTTGFDYDWSDFVVDLLFAPIEMSMDVGGAIYNKVFHGSAQNEKLESILAFKSSFNPRPFLNTILERKEEIINMVKEVFITELIQPMQEQIQEIRDKKGDKEKNLREANTRLVEIQKQKKVIEDQIQSIQALKAI